MAWQKRIELTEEAVVNNESLSMRLYYSDAASTPPNELRAEVQVTVVDEKTKETRGVLTIDKLVSDLLPNQQDAEALKRLVELLRDNALRTEGYEKA